MIQTTIVNCGREGGKKSAKKRKEGLRKDRELTLRNWDESTKNGTYFTDLKTAICSTLKTSWTTLLPRFLLSILRKPRQSSLTILLILSLLRNTTLAVEWTGKCRDMQWNALPLTSHVTNRLLCKDTEKNFWAGFETPYFILYNLLMIKWFFLQKLSSLCLSLLVNISDIQLNFKEYHIKCTAFRACLHTVCWNHHCT